MRIVQTVNYSVEWVPMDPGLLVIIVLLNILIYTDIYILRSVPVFTSLFMLREARRFGWVSSIQGEGGEEGEGGGRRGGGEGEEDRKGMKIGGKNIKGKKGLYHAILVRRRRVN